MNNPYIVPSDTIKLSDSNSFWDGYQSGNPQIQSVFFDDFNYMFGGSNSWTITETDAAATQAFTSGGNGLLLITNSAADNDIVNMQAGSSSNPALSFLPVTGRKIWFECVFSTNDVLQSEIAIGLSSTDTDVFSTSPFGGADGFIFQKIDGSSTFGFYTYKSSVPSGVADIGTSSNNQFIKVGFVVNGSESVDIWFNGDKVSTITTDLTGAALRPTIALKNGEAVAKTLTVDYIFAAQTRINPGY